jgi:hypothetical protein
MSVRLKSGRSAVRSRPWPLETRSSAVVWWGRSPLAIVFIRQNPLQCGRPLAELKVPRDRTSLDMRPVGANQKRFSQVLATTAGLAVICAVLAFIVLRDDRVVGAARALLFTDLPTGMIMFNEPLAAWNVAARALISVGCVWATRRHEEAAPVRSLSHHSLRSPGPPHPSAR